MVYCDNNDKILTKIAGLFKERLKEDVDVTLEMDNGLDKFCGEIKDGCIRAGSYAQLLDAAGRFLRNPRMENGRFYSQKDICGIYFATHFNNYLDAAPLEEIYRYITDLAFWGMNTLKLWFDMHHYRNMEDGRENAARLKSIMQYAKSIGVKTAICGLANEAFADSVKELRADWTSGHDGYIYDLNDHYHLEICPSKKGGMELICDYRREMLEEFRDVQPDYISIGAYDEGGCTCSECAPWGCNGYIRTCEEIIPLYQEYYPNAEIMLSTWQFGTFTGNNVEFEGLAQAMREGRLANVKYLVAEPQYARYPFEHEMPRPMIGFPEISMFHASPWGGYGANPMPRLLDRLWKENGAQLAGGWPYSEGLYEDLNKAIMLRLYRDNQPAEKTVREYLSYEFGLRGKTLEQTCRAVMDMEETLERDWDKETHRYVIKYPEKAERIEQTITEADAKLDEKARNDKKWQMLLLRAKIDGELVRNDFYRNDAVLGYFNRIIELEHLQNSGSYTKPDISD